MFFFSKQELQNPGHVISLYIFHGVKCISASNLALLKPGDPQNRVCLNRMPT